MEGQQAATEEEKLLEERAGDGAFVPRSTTPRLALPAACIYGNTVTVLHTLAYLSQLSFFIRKKKSIYIFKKKIINE